MSSYKHFSANERKCLQDLLEEGCSVRKIARYLGRSPSSVSREINRNKSMKGYNYWRAQSLTIHRRRMKVKHAIVPDSDQWNFVVKNIKLFWSPESICGRWKLEHPNEKPLSFSTIYRYIKAEMFPSIDRNNLRRKGKRSYSRDGKYNTIQPDRIIPDWPNEIKERARIGDFEGDTIYGGVGKGYVVTLVDRKSRFLLAGLLPVKTAQNTRSVVESLMHDLPVHSISFDNGSEFAEFRELEQSLNTTVYFAEPHKPWQRGTNENTNGILRFFFPKGYDFHSLTAEELARTVDMINDRPRKCLGWLSPREVMLAEGVAVT